MFNAYGMRMMEYRRIVMMKRYLILSGVLMILPSVLLAASADFTAHSRVVAAAKTSESKFFYAGDRWRMEERLPKGEYRVSIFRADKKCLYVLWPDKKRYLIQSLPEKEFRIISTRKPGEELERVALGQEKVSGYETTKYRVKYNVQGRTITGIEWFSKDLGIAIKSQAEDSTWSTEWANIKEGRQDSRLFEVPADYQLLSSKDVLTGPQERK